MAKESHSATDISTQIENLTCIRMASHQLTASVSAELQGNSNPVSTGNQTQYYNNNYYDSNPIGNDQLYIHFWKAGKSEDSVFDSTLLYQTPIFSKSDLKSKLKIRFL